MKYIFVEQFLKLLNFKVSVNVVSVGILRTIGNHPQDAIVDTLKLIPVVLMAVQSGTAYVITGLVQQEFVVEAEAPLLAK